MPTYTVRDPRSNRTVKLTGDSPPTEQELHQIFARLNAEQPPRSRADVLAAARDPRFEQGYLQDVSAGARAQLARTVFGGGDILRRGWNVFAPDSMDVERPITSPDVQAMMTPPDTAGGRAGAAAQTAAEYLVPALGVAKATKAAPWFTRTMAQAGTAAGVAGAQTQGDPGAMIAAAGTGAMGDVALRAGGAGLRAARDAAAGAREGGIGGAVARGMRAVAPSEPATMVIQAIKPRSTRTRFGASINMAMPEIKASERELGRPIASLQDFSDAINIAKRRVRSQYDEMAGPMRAAGWEVNLSPVADAMEASIPRKLQIENPDAALRLRNAAQVYRQPFSLEDAEQLLKETNAELEAFYNKYPMSQRRALLADPESIRLNAQAEGLRGAIYRRLDEEGGGAAAQALQRRYGALLELEGEAARRVNVAARQQPQSLSEQLSAARAAMEIARGTWRMVRGDLSGAADIAGGIAMRDTSKFLKEQQTTDALIRRAFEGFNQLPEPVLMPSHRPVAGLLGPGARQMPPAPDPSFARGVPAQTAMSERLALPPGREPLRTPLPEDPSFVRGVPAEYPRREVRGLLPRGETLPSSGRTFEMPGEVQPDPSGGRTIPAAPLDYAVDPTITVKAGGFRVKQFAGDPEAAAAAVATPEVRLMLRRMLEDLKTYIPQRGKLVRESLDTSDEHYAYGARGSLVGDDIRVISEQNVGNAEIQKAIRQLLGGATPTNRLHTGALDAAMGYIERRPGYNVPGIPDEFLSEDKGFEAFSRSVDAVRGKRPAKSAKRAR